MAWLSCTTWPVSKYRRVPFNLDVDTVLKEVCLEIVVGHEIVFLEIRTDRAHVHVLMQPVPMYSPTKIVRTATSIKAREIFRRKPAVRQQHWGGASWSNVHFIDTAGHYGGE